MIVLKGTQTSLPPIFRCGKNIDWAYEFTLPENGYYVGDEHEQKDWLKLCGVKPKFFDPQYDSKMVGFRWNLKTKLYEFCFYWHEKNKSFHIIDTDITSKSKVIVRFISNSISNKLHISIENLLGSGRGEIFENDSNMCYLINTFWGGSLPMEQTLFFGMEKLK